MVQQAAEMLQETSPLHYAGISEGMLIDCRLLLTYARALYQSWIQEIHTMTDDEARPLLHCPHLSHGYCRLCVEVALLRSKIVEQQDAIAQLQTQLRLTEARAAGRVAEEPHDG